MAKQQKKKYMSKTGKNTENRLEMIFMTKDQRICFQKVRSQNSCQSAFNHFKLAHKRPKRSNSTKIEMRFCYIVLKIAWKCFLDQIPKQTFFYKK